MEAISPVVRGLMNGFSLGNMLQQQRMDQRRLDMHQKQQEFEIDDRKRRRQFQQESFQANLMERLAEMGARTATPSDGYELDGGTGVQFNEGALLGGGEYMTTGPTQLPERTLAMPGTGQPFVLPSADERDARTAKANQRTLLDRNRAAAEAHAETLKQNEASAARQLDATGGTLSPEISKLFGMPPGAKVPASQIAAILRSIAASQNRPAPGAPNPSKVGYVTDHETGNITPIVPYLDAEGNPQLRSGKPGQGLARPRPRLGAGERGGSKPRKLTATEEANELVGLVLEGTKSANLDYAIENVKTHFQNDPRFTAGRRAQVIQRLKTMKANGGTNDGTNPLYKGPLEAGTVKGGYTFKGGDPAQESNWEKVQ